MDTPREEIESLLPRSEEGSIFCSCPFQKECWRDIRRPKIREAEKQGIKIYLPYICDYQQAGDLENCGHHEEYVKGVKDGYGSNKGAAI